MSEFVKVKLTGMWLNETKTGEKYMAGNLSGGVRLYLFRNNQKKPGSKEPDYNLFITPQRERRPERSQQAVSPAGGPPPPPPDDSDVPF